MTMKTELDELESQSYEGTLSRDPAVSRGAAVEEVEGELPIVGYRHAHSATRNHLIPDWEFTQARTRLPREQALTPQALAQERIYALEEELEQARLRNGDLLGKVTRLEARLEECRGLTESAMKLAKVIDRIGKRKEIKGIGGDENFVMAAAGLCITLDALSPATLKWAEGEGEEEE